MKRFASNFLFLPEIGYIKKCIIEIEEKKVTNISPFEKEAEAIVWYPGLLVLLSLESKDRNNNDLLSILDHSEKIIVENLSFSDLSYNHILGIECSLLGYYPYNFVNLSLFNNTRCEVLI